MVSQKICLSVLAMSLVGTAYSAQPQPPQRFDPAAAMQRLRDLKAQSQIIVRGNVDESIRKNREAEAETQRRMDEAAGKVSARMGEMSQEAANLMQQLDIYRENFRREVQAAANIDAQLLESMRQFKLMLDQAKNLTQEEYAAQKAEVKAIIDEYLASLQQSQNNTKRSIENMLRDMGLIE